MARPVDGEGFKDWLSNEQIAAVLNHMLTAWNNAELLPVKDRLYLPNDVAEHRRCSLTPAQVHAVRPSMPVE